MLQIHRLALILSSLFVSASVSAQPDIDRLTTFDFDQHESFLDIFHCADGGYAMCGVSSQVLYEPYPFHSEGRPYVVRVNDEFEVIWENTYDVGVPATASSIIEADNGDFVVGVIGDPRNFSSSGGKFIAFRVNAEGELIWQRDYSWGACMCVLELKSGDCILAGKWREAQGQRLDDSQIIRIDDEGQPVWAMHYDYGLYDHIRSIREGDGEVVCSGYRWEGVPYPNIFKIDADNGEVVWRILFDSQNSPRGYFDGLVSSAEGRFVTVGNLDSKPALIKFSLAGEIIWQRIYDNLEDGYSVISLARMSEGGYMLGGRRTTGVRQSRPLAIRVTSDGNFRWGHDYNIEEQGYAVGRNDFFSIINGPDDMILGAGEVRQANNGDYDGMVIKLESGRLGPRMIRYTPQDSSLYVLTGDSITFTLFAFGATEYRWFKGDDRIGRDDTLCTVVFPESGEDVSIRGVALDEDDVVSMEWTVHVRDLFITDVTPDTLALHLRRGSVVDFAIDTVQHNDGDTLEYLWTLANLLTNESREVGYDSSLWLTFPFSGHYALEAMAFIRQSSDMVVWDIEVSGAIWSYIPEESTLNVLKDDSLRFELIPTRSDTINRYDWFYNGELIASGRNSSLRLTFPEIGRQTITGILSDSSELDTVSWQVIVTDENSNPDDDLILQPSSFSLSAFPNPFNSSTTITFSAEFPPSIEGGRGGVSLCIYDLSGRLVADLSPAAAWPQVAAERKVVWDAADFGAGVYLVRLEEGGKSVTRKVVLMR